MIRSKYCYTTSIHRRFVADTNVGVAAILHIASALDLRLTTWEQVIVPALNGTLSILASACSHAGPQLEAFVWTSSTAAISDPSKSPYDFTEADWNDWAVPKAQEVGDAAPPGLLYTAAKTAAEKALWKFRDDKKVFFKPHFLLSENLNITKRPFPPNPPIITENSIR